MKEKEKHLAPKKNNFTKDNLVAVVFHIWRQFDDDYYAGFAAQVAYFFFMSSMPTMIVLTQMLGIFDLSLDVIQYWLETYVDPNISGFIMSLFSSDGVHLTNIILIIIALWAASGLEFALSRLTSHVLTEGQYKYNFFVERVKVIPSAVLTMVTVAFTLIIYVYGTHLLERLLGKYVIFRVLVALRLPILIGLFFCVIVMTYYILPRIRVPVGALIPGAIFATIGIMIITTIYGAYVGYVANYDILYGSFANIVALMLWCYLLSWVLCIGAMFNKAWDDVTGSGRLTPDKMKQYLERQKRHDKDVSLMFITEDDKYNPETASTAVRMSCKYVKGYEEQLRREKAALDAERKAFWESQDLYEDIFEEESEVSSDN